jgi:hypothetical protein
VTLIVCIPNFITMTLTGEETGNNSTASDVFCSSGDGAGSTTQHSAAEAMELTTRAAGSDYDTTATVSSAIIWNVGFKTETLTDKFMQSFNFWIQVTSRAYLIYLSIRRAIKRQL